jgi:cellulose synthase/poly-beta-1,6-N-acetylglucosamine synthase-like glycosyltransferase
MRLLLLVVVSVGMLLILVTLILAGGRGDLGDAVRRVNLPTPRSRLPRVGLLVISVVLAGCALAAENRVLAAASRAWTAALLHSAGLSAAQVTVYAPEVKPLIGALVLASLLLFHLIRPTSGRSLAAGIAVTALTGVALVLADSTVDAIAAAVGVPAVATVYAVTLTSLFVGLLGFMAILFRVGMLPRRYRYRAVVPALGTGLAITAVALVAILLGMAVFRLVAAVLQPTFAGSALLVFLVVPLTFVFFQSVLFLFRRKERMGKPGNPAPALDVIMPAWNEEAQIEATLRRIELAAIAYGGPVRVIIADDGSTDRTVELAEAVNRPDAAARIVVLRLRHAGKGPALNSALEFATAQIIVRIDADILVQPPVFNNLPGWFANPNVGCVGAFDLPNLDLPAWYTKGRLFECLRSFGFCRLGYERFDANNLPGTFLAFRRAEALALGGFVEGMNGEDTDLTFNFGRLGLVSVIDPTIVIYEDVPQSLREFINQRTRWSRAGIHVAARHLPRRPAEYTPRYVIQLYLLYCRLLTLIRPITFIVGAALILSAGRPANMMLRGLVLLTVGFVPPYLLLTILAVTYGFWRYLPWLVVWFPFTIVRKIAMLNGMLSVPAYRPARASRPGYAEPVGAEVAAVK